MYSRPGLFMCAGQLLGRGPGAPEHVAADRAADGAAGVLRDHEPAQRPLAVRRQGAVVSSQSGAPSGRNLRSTASERPGVSGTPWAPSGPGALARSGISRKNT